MHPLLLFSCLLLGSPMAIASATQSHAHAALDAHVHGQGELDVIQTEGGLELHWRSPAADLLGFEHAPRDARETAAVTALRQALSVPGNLVELPAAASCRLIRSGATSPLFDDAHASGHLEIEAQQHFSCATPAALDSLDLSGWFTRFPGSQQVRVQALLDSGQYGAELSAPHPRLQW